MKLNANQINEFTNQIVSNVERRLDKIIEIPLKNNSLDIFQAEWFTNLGFETEEDIKDLEEDEQSYMYKIWDLAKNIKDKFPTLSSTQDVRDFARLEIYDYVNNVLENKELNKHLMSQIEDYVEERSN